MTFSAQIRLHRSPIRSANSLPCLSIYISVNIMACCTKEFVLGKWSARQLRPNLPQDRCLSLRFRMRHLLIFRQEILKTTCLSDRNGGKYTIIPIARGYRDFLCFLEPCGVLQKEPDRLSECHSMSCRNRLFARGCDGLQKYAILTRWEENDLEAIGWTRLPL